MVGMANVTLLMNIEILTAKRSVVGRNYLQAISSTLKAIAMSSTLSTTLEQRDEWLKKPKEVLKEVFEGVKVEVDSLKPLISDAKSNVNKFSSGSDFLKALQRFYFLLATVGPEAIAKLKIAASAAAILFEICDSDDEKDLAALKFAIIVDEAESILIDVESADKDKSAMLQLDDSRQKKIRLAVIGAKANFEAAKTWGSLEFAFAKSSARTITDKALAYIEGEQWILSRGGVPLDKETCLRITQKTETLYKRGVKIREGKSS